MATGMEFMLKSMGLDPAAITEQINGYGELIKKFAEAIKRIEDNQSATHLEIMETLKRIEDKLNGTEENGSEKSAE